MNLLKPNEGRSKLAIQLVICVVIMDIVGLFSNTLECQLLSSGAFSVEDGTANDTRQQIIAVFYSITYIISIVVFIRWFRRAYYNIHQRAEVLNYSDDWASIAWFIPIVSLYRPYQITREIFEETDQYLNKNKPDYKEKISFTIVGIWWFFWIVNNIFSNISFRVSLSAETLDDFITASILNIINNLLGIISGIFAVLMIKEYSKIETLFYETEKKEVLKTSISNRTIEEKKADL